jgi:hypothetical protein|tara:strand:+ start:20 stop:754 length:735 start_codon:yes stop_codon:yes gene_type:complete
MKFSVLHLCTEELKPLRDLTIENKTSYCKSHNYNFIDYDSKDVLDFSKEEEFKERFSKAPEGQRRYLLPRELVMGWAKVKLLIDLLERDDVSDWFFWIDADAIFMNHHKRLDQFVSNDPNQFFIVGKDCNGINVGTFFLKNCERSLKFLKELWQVGPQVGSWVEESEQGQLSILGQSEKYMDGFYIVRNTEFNSYVHDCWKVENREGAECQLHYKYENGDFVIHLPGIPNKAQIISKLLELVIR